MKAALALAGAASATAQCSQDPTFKVIVHAGLVVVTYASGFMVLHSAQGLKFDSITKEVTPIEPGLITGATAVFTTQLRQLRLTPIPQAIAFTSPALKAARTGDTYQVSATGGASGRFCSISSPTPSTIRSPGRPSPSRR